MITMTKATAALAAFLFFAVFGATPAAAQSACDNPEGALSATVQAGQPFSFNWCQADAPPAKFLFLRNGQAMNVNVIAVAEPVGTNGLRRYAFVTTEPVPGKFEYRINAVSGVQTTVSPIFTVTALAAQLDVCAPPDPASANVTTGQRTLRWCFRPVTTSGGPVSVTGWALYVGATRTVLTGVTVGLPTASGRTPASALLPASLTAAAGTFQAQLAAISAGGVESARSGIFTVTVTEAPPEAPAIRGVD